MMIVGIDVSKQTLDVAWEAGGEVRHQCFAYTAEGMEALLAQTPAVAGRSNLLGLVPVLRHCCAALAMTGNGGRTHLQAGTCRAANPDERSSSCGELP
jgi:transposase